MTSIQDDPRLDPRVKAVLGQIPTAPEPDVTSRDAMVAAASTPEAVELRRMMDAALDQIDDEAIAPSG
ncbi:MAG: esterase, partial [Acidimicrobiia bacterium]